MEKIHRTIQNNPPGIMELDIVMAIVSSEKSNSEAVKQRG